MRNISVKRKLLLISSTLIYTRVRQGRWGWLQGKKQTSIPQEILLLQHIKNYLEMYKEQKNLSSLCVEFVNDDGSTKTTLFEACSTLAYMCLKGTVMHLIQVCLLYNPHFHNGSKFIGHPGHMVLSCGRSRGVPTTMKKNMRGTISCFEPL